MPVQPPFRPQAVLFDLDGVLVDSEPLWGEAERQVVADHGRPWDESVRTAMHGRGPDDAARILADHLGVDDTDAVERQLLVAMAGRLRRDIRSLSGARELLADLAGRVPVAVVTNSRRVLADLSLVGTGLDEWVTTLVAAEDSPAAKPAPDPYLTAAATLGVDPAACIAIEDSEVGIAAAVAAGCWTVACPTFEGQGTGDAHVVVRSLTELDASDLLGSVAPWR